MSDNLTPEQRRVAMRRVKSKNTSPEIAIRRLLHQMGIAGYRLHRRDVPGSPDIAWLSKKAAIFIHGCFWHAHDCPRGSRKPKTNRHYWQTKLARNIQRDSKQRAELKKKGWDILTIWECELKDESRLARRLNRFFARPQ
jgi:DNA mismatch endonuclease (patch repair protein)